MGIPSALNLVDTPYCNITLSAAPSLNSSCHHLSIAPVSVNRPPLATETDKLHLRVRLVGKPKHPPGQWKHPSQSTLSSMRLRKQVKSFTRCNRNATSTIYCFLLFSFSFNFYRYELKNQTVTNELIATTNSDSTII